MASEIPILAPLEAIAFYRRKGLAIGFAWQDAWEREHVRAFTVAKAMSRDLLEDIRAAVDKAIAEGQTLRQFQDGLRPLLEARGWWGRKEMTDPLTTARRVVQLGSPRRLRTIFEVNMRMAYQAGRWERMERNAAAFPYVRYVSAEDSRVRPQHQAWHGTIKPLGDPWWNTHYPPCGWHCRCTAVPVNQRMMDRRGWTETDRPASFLPNRYVNPRTGEETMYEAGISPGFGYNVGRAYLDDLAANPLPAHGEEDALAAAEDDAGRTAAFVAAFGIEGDEIERGRVFLDKGGWPLAISSAWLRSAAGGFVLMGTADQLALAGRAIAEPGEIRWRWVTGNDGKALLFRRYIANFDGVDVVVDVGREGWRFATSNDESFDLERFRAGTLAWTKDSR